MKGFEMSLHVVVGAGPVGSSIARLLAERGDTVRLVTRSGSGPKIPGIELFRADAADAAALTAAAAGATTLFNCVNPPYTTWSTTWPPIAAAFLAAAERSGARLVTTGNLYGYGPVTTPMRPDTPLQATGKKGATRARMWTDALAAHRAGRVRAVEVRASDFFGPGVSDAAMGERIVPRVTAGKRVQLLGDAAAPHSWSFMPDVARTMVTVADDESAFGRAWHVPSETCSARELVAAFAAAAGRPTPTISVVGKPMLSVAGIFVPMMRELKETFYQFDRPFICDASETTQRFGITATPLAESAAATVAWFRSAE